MAGARVLVDAPPFPLEIVRDVLDGVGAAEDAPRPWAGDDVVGLLAWDPVEEQDFQRLPALKVVATCSVGYDHIDLAAAERRRVWVCCVPDYCVDEVADSALAHLLALLRGVVILDRRVRAGAWDEHGAGPLRQLAGTRLGVIGFGRIGRALASRARALELEVWATDPLVPEDVIAGAGVRPAALDELLASCTAVSLHVPLTPETEGLIGERELALMPPGSYLVNVSRAGLLDWPAFVAALESGRLAGAGVDVLPVEPPTPEHPVPALPNLIVTPHSAWYSPDAERAVYRRAALSVRAVLEGREPDGAVVRP
jgi:D-3-phosphoglycerate dehydrogenase / 2-oxoglutarate reductase